MENTCTLQKNKEKYINYFCLNQKKTPLYFN